MIALVYLTLAFAHLRVPTPTTEELEEAAVAFRYLGRPLAEAPEGLLDFMPGLVLFDRYFPIAQDTPYLGAVELYLELPVLRLLGLDVFSLRSVPIVIALAALLAAYVLLRRLVDERLAFWAALLTASHPVFVHFSRQGHRFDEIFTLAFLLFAAFFLVRGATGGPGQRLSLALGGLAFGLGISHKITFLWYVLAAVPVLLLALRWRLLGSIVRRWPLAVGAAVVGTVPVLVNLLGTRFAVPRMMLEALLHGTRKDNVDNLDFLVNLWVRGRQLLHVMVKGQIWDPAWFTIVEGAERPYNWPAVGAFLVGCVALPLLLVLRRDAPWARGLLLVTLFYLGVLLCSPFTVSMLRPSHLLVLVPFPMLVLAAPFALPHRWLGDRPWARALALCVLLVCFVGNLHVCWSVTLRALEYSGDSAPWELQPEEHWANPTHREDRSLDKVDLPTRW